MQSFFTFPLDAIHTCSLYGVFAGRQVPITKYRGAGGGGAWLRDARLAAREGGRGGLRRGEAMKANKTAGFVGTVPECSHRFRPHRNLIFAAVDFSAAVQSDECPNRTARPERPFAGPVPKPSVSGASGPSAAWFWCCVRSLRRSWALRCRRQIDLVAYRAFDGGQWMDREGCAATIRNTYCGNLLWQSSQTLSASV